jgi:hypothetical protein
LVLLSVPLPIRLHGIRVFCYAIAVAKGWLARLWGPAAEPPSGGNALNQTGFLHWTERSDDGPAVHGELRRARVNEDDFDTDDIDKMLQRLEELRARHRDLDAMIERLETDGGQDFRIMGLKREKLRIKDRIVWLSSKLTPDIIA